MARWLLLAALCAVAAPAAALRCGTSIVTEGDSTLLLRKHCGPPTQIDRYQGRTPVRGYDPFGGGWYIDYVVEPYEVWTYNFGPSRFITRIRVRNGIVESIETGGYGY
jgi:hypothetical protein